jgi:acyl-CoA reductase-like NAD-dependent aldehyde dehydrogenase
MSAAALVEQVLPGGIASLIAGHEMPGRGAEIVIEDPATGRPHLSYSDGGAEAAGAAMDAAEIGGRHWRAMTASARGLVLFRLSDLIRRDAETLAHLEAATAGKPIRDARAEVGRVADMVAYYAGWADKIAGDVLAPPTSHLNLVLREPLGTIVQITPWNAPVFTGGWQMAPALAAGNAVVLKPSELTPVTTILLGRLAIEAGVPPAAVNVVAGYGHTAGAALTADPRCGKVVFIGSVATGRAVAANAAKAGRPALLELGGKSANIVFADADLPRAAKAAQMAIFAAAGQSCTAGSRLLVQQPVYERMVDWVASGAARIKVGPPLDPATEMGPINNRRQFDRVTALIATGTLEGARLATGGGRPANQDTAEGFFVAPTVFADVAPDMTIAREEIFGPVLTVMPFRDEDEALHLANGGDFDLAGGIWTGDAMRAARLARQLRAGTVWVNSWRSLWVGSPFGGMAGSGFGRSSGRDVMLEYTQAKSVWFETDPTAAIPFGYGPGEASGE